jgi:flagellin
MGQSDLSANINNAISNTSIQRLSSGLRVESAGDDAAGLAVREYLRADIASARQGSRNVSDGVSMAQTADAASQTISDNLIRMKELATQASNGILTTEQKTVIQREFDQLAAENTRIADTTQFNGQKLFADGETIAISFGSGNTVNIQTQAIAGATADLVNGAPEAMQTVDAAINQLSALRGGFGAVISQLESAGEIINVTAENILAAESRISDTDMARQAATLTAAEIQAEVAMASQAQANLLNDAVLSLIK